MRKRFTGRLLSEPFTLAAIIYLIGLALLALLADFIAPYDAMEQSLISRNLGPSADFLLGTDGFGRDLLSRVIFGARFAFQSLFVSLSIALSIGVPACLASQA